MEKLDLKKKNITTHNMRKLIPYYKKSKKLILLLFLLSIVGGLCSVLSPIYSANSLASLAEQNFRRTIKYAVIMFFISCARHFFNILFERVYIRIDSNTKFELTKKLINSISSTKMKTLDSVKLGALAGRLSSDVSSVSDSYLSMINVVMDIITNVVFLFYIAFLNLPLFAILLIYVVLLYGLCTLRSRVWIRGKQMMKRSADEARSAYLEEIGGIRDVKLLNIEKNVTEYSNKKYLDSLRLEISVNDKRTMLRRFQNILSNAFELLFITLGIIFIKKEFILLAGFLVIYTYYGKVENLVNYLSSYKEYKAEGEISATRIFEVIEDYEKETFGADILEDFSGRVELKNVNFSYSEGTPVLKGMNMLFEPNKMTAIVGKSGSGKSTVLNLISKLYDISDGEILFDNKDIRVLTRDSIRSNVCEISQSPYIFNTTIRQNLLFCKPDATEDELIAVLKEAQIYDDVMKMEKGLDTEIGENGVKISGGQRQRLAIARLLLKDTKVIVFDEATSALDNGSQSKIVELLDSLKDRRTIIIVAHRLSTIIGADKIYMIEEGKLVGEGTHKELMRTNEKYNELYSLEENSNDDGAANLDDTDALSATDYDDEGQI